MTCLKTGADIYLAPENATFRGDVYMLGDVYTFRLTNASRRYGFPAQDADWIVEDWDQWFDTIGTFSTLVTKSAKEV